jgi:hypothetical protein
MKQAYAVRMNRKQYHVTKSPDGNWKGTLAGGSRASVSGETKKEVVQKTIQIAKSQGHSQVVIHKENGVIQTEHTYGQDPRHIKG